MSFIFFFRSPWFKWKDGLHCCCFVPVSYPLVKILWPIVRYFLSLGTLWSLFISFGMLTRSDYGTLSKGPVSCDSPLGPSGVNWETQFLCLNCQISLLSSISSLLSHRLSFLNMFYTSSRGSSQVDSWLVPYLHSFDGFWFLSWWVFLVSILTVLSVSSSWSWLVGLTFLSTKYPVTYTMCLFKTEP